MRRAKSQPWFQDVLARARFERGTRTAFPGIQVTATGRSSRDEVVYRCKVTVPGYEARLVTVRLMNAYRPIYIATVADGPTDSPHRFSGERLCMWHPDDPPELRWTDDDGLLTLLRHVQVHLFKEAWWRETGEWLGEEAPHSLGSPKAEER